MNYRTILLASAAVMFAGSAMAADLTNPFYLPGEGQLTSDTSFEYGREKMKHHAGADDSEVIAEEVMYGVSDNFALKGVIANAFDTEGRYNNDHNFGYEIGGAYNMRNGNVLGQVNASYATWNPKDFYGKRNAKLHNDGNDRWQKVLTGEVKLGYDAGNGLTPYASYGVEGNIDSADRYLLQTARLGVHKYTGDWAFDGALRYDFDTDGKNANQVWAEAAADYYLKDNVALGIYGDYYLAGNGSEDVDYSYDAGVHAKVLF